MAPPGRSAALRALYGDRSSTRETPPPSRRRSPARSRHDTDTPDSGFFDDEQEVDISQSELDQIARWEAAESSLQRQRREEEDAARREAIEAAHAQAVRMMK